MNAIAELLSKVTSRLSLPLYVCVCVCACVCLCVGVAWADICRLLAAIWSSDIRQFYTSCCWCRRFAGQISRSSCSCCFYAYHFSSRIRHVAAEATAQLRHRDVMWTAVLLCACAATAAVTSLSELDGDSTPGQTWVDKQVSKHPVM